MAHSHHSSQSSLSDEQQPLPLNTTAVAIDKDKNSQHAVKWAVDHLLINSQLIILIHVKHRFLSPHDLAYATTEAEINQLYTPYRAYCARKSVQIKEVVLEDNDVPKAIIDYVSKNAISNVVVGASNRSFIKNFKKLDVPSTLSKTAPNFCSVYVIQKGKVISVRSANRAINNTVTPPKHQLASSFTLPPQLFSSHSSQDEGSNRGGSQNNGALNSFGSNKFVYEKTNSEGSRRQRHRSSYIRSGSKEFLPDCHTLDVPGASSESPDRHSDRPFISAQEDEQSVDDLAFESMDFGSCNLDFSIPGDDKSGPTSTRDLESEMRRLKLELKQTMDMYSNACKEALVAKQKAKELDEWKQEERRRLEQARLSEEAALALAEMEKAKCRAAIEAAEAAQRLAEMEAHRRKLAEIKAKQEGEAKVRALSALSHHDVRYRRYTVDELEAATDKFSLENKIGEGGYGPVYKGKLDHTPVAIKVLKSDCVQGRKQFQQEVEVLSCMRHPNMVLLLGACPDNGCLVYEYMNNGSLEDRLLRRNNTPTLSWRIRFKIAAEIVTALTFLHQSKPEPLVHRDLKPANILLDQNYVSKISDVGLARLVPPKVADQVTQYYMTSAAGTFCYIDPEYQQTGMLSTKSDVYSLGIMLLQILTARSPMGLTHHVHRAIDEGTFEKILDPTVTDWPVEQALRFARIALKCSELRKKDRPDTAKVVLPELISLRDFALEGMGDDQLVGTT